MKVKKLDILIVVYKDNVKHQDKKSINKQKIIQKKLKFNSKSKKSSLKHKNSKI